VAHLFDNARDETDDLHEPAPRRRRRWVPVVVAAGLALFGSASALLWHAWDGGFPALPSFASGTAPGAAPAEVPDKTVGLKDFQAFQQQIAATVQSTAQLVAAQQAEIKRLSDQVSALAAKIDALQRPAASAQAAAPVPPTAPAPAARKKPAAAKPPPGISTGGAPLPLTGR
jgi:cell division protein FtsB